MSTRPVSSQELVERALALSRTDGCIVIADESSDANLRWAGNTLTTNGVTRSRSLTVIATVSGADGVSTGMVSRSNVDPAQVGEVVGAAEEIARRNPPAEDAMPLLSPGPSSPGDHGVSVSAPQPEWEDEPAETSIRVFDSFAPALGESFGKARAGDRLLFGFAEHSMTTTYLGTSTGIRLRHDQPEGKVELNAKSPDYARSAWDGVGTRDFTDIDVIALDAQLAGRLEWAKRSVELPAGRYETLLPPSAVADLMVYLYWSAAGRDAAEGRTVFSGLGGTTRIGEELATAPVTLRSDPAEPGMECAPFVIAYGSGSTSSVFDNGLPLGATDWIRDGKLEALLQTRWSAQRYGMPMTPGVDNLVMSSAQPAGSLDEMVARIERGLLLTCLWYIREVDPQTLLLTGLTRDGVYLVENGEVTGAVNNFRFNESPVDLLGRLAEIGTTEHTLPREWNDYFTRTAMPAIRVPDFNMSSVSAAQ